MLAVSEGHLEAVKALIHRGAGLDLRDNDGMIPLEWALGVYYDKLEEYIFVSGIALHHTG